MKEELKKEYEDGENKKQKKDKEKTKVDNEIYSYEIFNFNLDDIVKSIGQIRLFGETKVEEYIRNANNLIPDVTKTLIRRKKRNKEELEQHTPELENYYLKMAKNYCFINEIFELLKKEEFF